MHAYANAVEENNINNIIKIEGCEFEFNYAYVNGGSLFLHEFNQFSFISSNFTKNLSYSMDQGGSIYAYSSF